MNKIEKLMEEIRQCEENLDICSYDMYHSPTARGLYSDYCVLLESLYTRLYEYELSKCDTCEGLVELPDLELEADS